MKRSLAMVMALIMVMSSAVIVSAEEIPSIVLGEIINLEFLGDVEDEMYTYLFTPEKTGYYTFESFSIEDETACDVNITIYNSNGNWLCDDDDSGNEDNFFLVKKLDAKSTYKIEIASYGYSSGKNTFTVTETVMAESISIDMPNNTFSQYALFEIEAIAPNREYVDATWSVSDNAAVDIYWFVSGVGKSTYYVTFLESGTFDITVTLENGVSDTAQIVIEEPVEITEGIMEENVFYPGSGKTFSFTPEESGEYVFYTESSVETYIDLYEKTKEGVNRIASSNDYAENYNAALYYHLEADKTYISEVGADTDTIIDIGVAVKKLKNPESVSLNDIDELLICTGDYCDIECVLSPEGVIPYVEWTSNNEDTVYIKDSWIKNGKVYARVYCKSAGTATITVTTENGFSDSIKVTGSDKFILEEDVPLEAYFTGNSINFEFTPKYDDVYKFYAISNDDTFGILTDSEGNLFGANHDGGIGDNFMIEKKLTAGKTYNLEMRMYYDQFIPTTVCAYRVTEKATSVEISGIEDSATYGKYSSVDLEVITYPMYAASEDHWWKSSNEDVVNFEGDTVVFNSEGTATITVTTENGLTDSFEVTVTETPELLVNREIEVVCKDNEYLYYEFRPSLSGTYIFYSEGSCDPIIYLQTADFYDIDSDDDSGRGYNFYLEAELVAGETYYLKYYGFNPVVEATVGIIYENIHMGDLNSDNMINGIDVTLLRRSLVDTHYNFVNVVADLNNDGKVNQIDVTLLRRYIVSL